MMIKLPIRIETIRLAVVFNPLFKKPPEDFRVSPVVWLSSDFNYENVYQDGYDIIDPEWETDATGKPTDNKLSNRSIIIFRYYDPASKMLGAGETPPIVNSKSKCHKIINLRCPVFIAMQPSGQTRESAHR